MAANFCAKEAFFKAIGTGISKINMNNIQILREKTGKPFLYFSDFVRKMYGFDSKKFQVSISHTKENAVAVVLSNL